MSTHGSKQAHGFDLGRLTQRFFEKFGASENKPDYFFAPGRVNLIGDHTDYTGGLVFPCGIDSGNLVLMRRTQDNHYRFASTNFDLLAQLTKDQIGRTYGDNWINYPLGVVDQFVKGGINIDGIDCLFSGNVPNGAGLSSSAAIEVVTAFALNELFDCNLSLIELVHMSQAAENDFVGMQCGIMDQFAVAMAQEQHAMMLNCATLDYRQIPLKLQAYSIVLANTNQRRELNESAYNQRVAECNQALNILQQAMQLDALGQLSVEQLEKHRSLFNKDTTAFKRAHHIASENARVRAAIPALEAGDLATFGKLMLASHESLRDNFEVSSDPLDHLVNITTKQQGVLGSRLTGAGFGGCTVSLVPTESLDKFKKQVGQQYKEQTGLSADFYVIEPSSGVSRVNP